MQHETTVTDTSGEVGYGRYGHGTYRIDCSCGWVAYTQRAGSNAARMVAEDHEHHQMGYHSTGPVHGCEECGRAAY